MLKGCVRACTLIDDLAPLLCIFLFSGPPWWNYYYLFFLYLLSFSPWVSSIIGISIRMSVLFHESDYQKDCSSSFETQGSLSFVLSHSLGQRLIAVLNFLYRSFPPSTTAVCLRLLDWLLLWWLLISLFTLLICLSVTYICLATLSNLDILHSVCTQNRN